MDAPRPPLTPLLTDALHPSLTPLLTDAPHPPLTCNVTPKPHTHTHTSHSHPAPSDIQLCGHHMWPIPIALPLFTPFHLQLSSHMCLLPTLCCSPFTTLSHTLSCTLQLLYLYIDEVDNCDYHTLPSPKDLRERYTYNIVPLATEQPSHSSAIGTIRDFFKGKAAKHTPRLCPPPSRGASLLPSWKFRLPEAKLVSKVKPPQLHIDQRKHRAALSLPFASASSSGNRRGIVLDSAAADLSTEFPQQCMDLDSILYTMDISDHLHSYSAQRATLLPQIASSPTASSKSTSPDSITDGKSPRGDPYQQTPPPMADSATARSSRWTGSVPYSSVGELANLLIAQGQ